MRVQGKIQIFIFKGTLMKMFQRKHIQICSNEFSCIFWKMRKCTEVLLIKSPSLWILGIRNLAFVQIYVTLSFTKKSTRFILQISLLTPVTLGHTVQNGSLNWMLQILLMVVKILIVLELCQKWLTWYIR